MKACEPAFPTIQMSDNMGLPYLDYIPGLTKREHLAAMVLWHIANGQPIVDSELAVKYADALIEALNK